jgi:drug/metabolite transporter (DMT)-like permease
LIRFQALLGVLGISFSAIFLRLSGVSPVTAAFFRGLYALPVLVSLWPRTRSLDTRSRASRIRAMGSGIFLALDLVLWHQAVLDIGAGLATVLVNAQVLFVAGLAWLLHRERPSRRAIVLIPVVLVGVVLISGLGRADAYGANPVRGVILALVAAALYAMFQLLFRDSNRTLAPPTGPVLDATIGMTVGALVLAAPFDPRFSVAFSWPAHGWLIVMAIICQALAWILLGAAFPRLPALETSVILLSQPMETVVWGWLILNERMSVIQAAGMLVMTTGIALLLLSGTVMSRTPPNTRNTEEAFVGP